MKIDHEKEHYCPVYKRIIDPELCYESAMCLSGLITIASIEELHRIATEESRKFCAECPYSDMS